MALKPISLDRDGELSLLPAIAAPIGHHRRRRRTSCRHQYKDGTSACPARRARAA